MEVEEKEKKTVNDKKKKLVVPVLVCIIVILVLIILPSKEGKIKNTLKTSLEKIAEKSDLETATITYNIIAKKCKKENDCNKESNKVTDFEYVLYCEGSVTAGIDFSKIEIEKDRKNKVFIIHLPDANIIGEPNIGTVKFLDGSSIPAAEYANARKYCQDEVKAKTMSDDKLIPAAKDQVRVVLGDYYKQWIKAYDSSYDIEFK